MNTLNNKRKRESQKKIEKVFVELLQKKELSEISVTEICKLTKLNRSTFYANYLDVEDLAIKIKEKLNQQIDELYKDEREHDYNSNNFQKLFEHIKENQIFYKTYFKLGYDHDAITRRYDINLAEKYFNNKFVNYHMEFFRSGLNAIIKIWIENNCKETPAEMQMIIQEEYKGREIN